MTGADKVVCQAATLLLLFTLTTMPARAQFGSLGGGGGGISPARQDNAGRISGAGPLFGPHRVKMTLAADSTPSTTMEAAANTK